MINRKELSWELLYMNSQASQFSSSFNFSGGSCSIPTVKKLEDLPVS